MGESREGERRSSRWGLVLKIASAVAGMLGSAGAAYFQASADAEATADVAYQTTTARLAEMEQAVDYLAAELALIKAREVLAEHDLPPETLDELEEIFASEGLALHRPSAQPAQGGRRGSRPGRRTPSSPPPGPAPKPEALAEITANVRRAHDAKREVAKPEWLGEPRKKPSMPRNLEEAAQQKIWLK
jgi:hypothetical protein